MPFGLIGFCTEFAMHRHKRIIFNLLPFNFQLPSWLHSDCDYCISLIRLCTAYSFQVQIQVASYLRARAIQRCELFNWDSSKNVDYIFNQKSRPVCLESPRPRSFVVGRLLHISLRSNHEIVTGHCLRQTTPHGLAQISTYAHIHCVYF